MRKSRISFSIQKKHGKSDGSGDSNAVSEGAVATAATGQTPTNLKPSSYYACRFCCKRFKNQDGYEIHCKSRKHTKSWSIGSEFELKKSHTCASCKHVFDTRKELTDHCEKKSHMPLLQKTGLRNPVYGKACTESEQEDPFVSIKYYSPYYCEVCDLDCVNEMHYNDHVKGERHEKTAEKRAEQGKTALVDLETSEVDTSEMCLVIMNKIEAVTESVSAYYCGICDMDCRSEVAYTEHVTSKEHQVKMEGHGQIKFTCDLCCMTFNSENNHKMHFRSKKHASNLAARQRLLPLDKPQETEKESMHDMRDKIKRTISPPLESFDKIKVNKTGESLDEGNTRSIVVDINADEDDVMAMGMPKVTLDKKEKKELERKLKADEEERGKWAKKREEEYGKKKAEILKSSRWEPKSASSVDGGKSRGRGRNLPVVFKAKYKWVAPTLRTTKSESSNSHEKQHNKSDSDKYDSRYSKESSRDRSKDRGSHERHSRDDSRREKQRDSKSDRRRKDYDDDDDDDDDGKYRSDSDSERVILKKGSRKESDEKEEDDEDLRKVINKQRGIVEKSDRNSLVIDYGHQSGGDKSEERAGLKGFFGGAFAHLRDNDSSKKDREVSGRDEKKAADKYGERWMKDEVAYDDRKKKDEIKEPEKELGKDMERTLLLELLKRQFPDIRYLTEREGGLELMQKIFGAQGMSGLALLGGNTPSGSAIRNDDAVAVNSQTLTSEGSAPARRDQGSRVTKSESREMYQSKRERSYSRERSDSRERRSDSPENDGGNKKSRSRKRSRSSSRDRYSKRSRRTPTPEGRKKYEKYEKNSENSREGDSRGGGGENEKREELVSETKAKSKEAMTKAIAKWTVSNWSGGNSGSTRDDDRKEETREREDERVLKKSERKDERKEERKYKERWEDVDTRKTRRIKDASRSGREDDKKRERNNSDDKIFEDASDYEDIDLTGKGKTKESSRRDEKNRDDRHGNKEKHRGSDVSGRRGRGNSKSSDDKEKRRESDGRDEKRRKKSHDRDRYDDRDFKDDEKDEMDELQRDLLANLARVENLGRTIPQPFPMAAGTPFMSAHPISAHPITMPPPPMGLMPTVGAPFPLQGSGLGPRMNRAPNETEESSLPPNSSTLRYVQKPKEQQKLTSLPLSSPSTEQALKDLLSQVSALGSGTKSTSTTLSKSMSGVGEDDQKTSSELQRLGELYSDDHDEGSDDVENSSSKPLKSILKKKSKFSAGQSEEGHGGSSGLPKNAVGAEYVVNTGEQAKYFCQLCDVQFATLSAKNLHLRGPKHLAMFMKHKSPLIDEMIQQAMGVAAAKTDGNDDETEEKSATSKVIEARDSGPSASTIPKRGHGEDERSESPYESLEPRSETDERKGRSDIDRARAGHLDNTSITDGRQQSTSNSDVSKLEVNAVATSDEYERLSQRARDVLSREEYAQLPPGTRKLLLLETGNQQPSAGNRDEAANPRVAVMAARDTTIAGNSYTAVAIKDYEELSLRARSLLTREEYERLPERDKEYLSKEEYLTREEQHNETSRDPAAQLSREEYELVARERERLAARDLIARESLDRIDRERLMELDRLTDRERFTLADRDRLALADRERLALADRDRLLMADRDRLALVDRDRLALVDRERLALADRDRLAVLADRDRLVEREYFDRYSPREDLPYRSGPDEYGRGGLIPRDDFGRLSGPIDEELRREELRREEYMRPRMRDEYGRPIPPREGLREGRDVWERLPPGREAWERPLTGREPRDDRPHPARDYRDWDRSREVYPRDPQRMVSERGPPTGGYVERGSPPRDWPQGPVHFRSAVTEREPPLKSGPKVDIERRQEDVGKKGMESIDRHGSYDSHASVTPRDVTDMRGFNQQSYRGHRGRAVSNRGGPPRGQPRNAPFRGQPRRGGGGQGRY